MSCRISFRLLCCAGPVRAQLFRVQSCGGAHAGLLRAYVARQPHHCQGPDFVLHRLMTSYCGWAWCSLGRLFCDVTPWRGALHEF